MGLRSLLPFLAWTLVGLLGAFGVAALLTIGLPFVLAAIALGGILVWRQAASGGAPLGLGLGAGLLIAYLGWLSRGGPGTVCHSTSHRGSECVDEWSPWPFFALAAIVAVGAIVLFARRSRQR